MTGEKQTPCAVCRNLGKRRTEFCDLCRENRYERFWSRSSAAIFDPSFRVDQLKPSTEPSSTETGTKHDAGKPRTDLLQAIALVEVAKVAEFGAREYGEENWRLVKGWRRRYLAAALRHLFAHMASRGQDDGLPLDEKTKLPHLAHAAWNCLSLLELSILEGDNK